MIRSFGRLLGPVQPLIAYVLKEGLPQRMPSDILLRIDFRDGTVGDRMAVRSARIGARTGRDGGPSRFLMSRPQGLRVILPPQ